MSRDEDRGRSRNRDDDRDDDRGSRRGRDDDRGGRDRDDDRSSRRGGRDRDDEDRGSRGRSGGRGGFEYQRRSAEDTRQRASKGANDFDRIMKEGVKMWKPNDGDNRIRILPPTWAKAKHFGLDIYVHYGVGPDRQSYLCLNKMEQDGGCPVCEEREIARRDEDEKYAKELEAKRRVLVYLIDRDHEKEGPQVWAMPWTLDRDIVKVCQDKSSGEVLEIDHPEEGYDVTFEKKGSKDRTEYLGVSIARRSSPLGKDEWLDHAVDFPLDTQLNYFDHEHIAKVFNGGGAQRSKRDDDRDEDRSPRRSSRDEPEERGGRSSRDDGRDSRRGGKASDEPTWESVHDMTKSELEDLIEDNRLDINPKEAKDVEDLADWVCEEMKLTKARASESRRSSRDEPEEDRGGGRRRVNKDEDPDEDDRLARMRRNRERD